MTTAHELRKKVNRRNNLGNREVTIAIPAARSTITTGLQKAQLVPNQHVNAQNQAGTAVNTWPPATPKNIPGIWNEATEGGIAIRSASISEEKDANASAVVPQPVVAKK